MSEFIATAQVLVVPDTSKFRAQLQAQLLAATKGAMVPISVTPVSAKGIAGAAAATTALSEAQASAQAEMLALSRTVLVENAALVKQIELLKADVAALLQVAGAESAAASARKKSTATLLGAGSATAKLDAGLLGLRTALGSTAVIGLGAAALAAIAAGKAFRQMLIDTAAFEQELSTFRAVTGATADEMARVSDAATALGADVKLPAVSAADAAVAMTELAKAGLSVQDSIAGAEGVLQLATAAQLSNADASQIAANALNSFGLAGDQAVRVADDFANAANAAQGSIADIGLAFRQASAVARQVGLSLEDTTAILSLFAKNGLQGSDAGTSLRVALIRLVAPTKAAAAEIKTLGLNIRDAQGNLRADVFAQFGEATKNLGPAARDAAAALIFGQDAIRAVSIGAREGAEGLRIMQAEIDQQGTAAEVAAARTEGLAGAFGALQSNAQTLGITIGSIVSGPLTSILNSLNKNFAAVEKFAGALRDLSQVKIPPIRIPLTIVNLPGGPSASDIAQKAIGEVSKTILSGGILGRVAIAGLTEAFTGLSIEAKITRARVKELEDELQALQTARVEAERATPGPSPIADEITARIKATREEIKKLKSEGSGIDAALTTPFTKALAALEKVRDIRISQGLDTSAVDRFILSIERAANEAGRATQKINDLPDGITRVGDTSRTAASGVDALAQALKGLNAAAFSANSALLKLQNEGAGPQAQIANLQGQRKIQEDIIANIKANGNQAGDATKINAAREEINRIQAQIDSLQAGIVSDQKSAADSARKAADDAQTQRDKQFQALADLFGGRQSKIENLLARAGIAGNVQKELNLNKALITALKKERDALLARLKTLKVSADLRKRIMAAINAAIQDAQQDQIRFQQEQQDNLLKVFDFRVSLAQARDDTVAELKARRQRLSAITAELARLKNAHKKNTDRWRELKLAQAEEIAAIKDLEGQSKEKNNAQKSLFFTFLQTQQGFAANLLGNLIPGFATKGLVGGSTPDAGQAAFQTQPRVAQEAAVATSRERGVRPVQVDTTNHLLRQILHSLQNLNGRQSSPEARYQRSVASGGMDTVE